MEAFFHYCHKAGPSNCAFYSPASQTIRTRYFALLDSLKMRPVFIPPQANGTVPTMPELVTYSKLQILIRTVLYKPFYQFPLLAKVLAALEDNDGLPFYNMANDEEKPLKPTFCWGTYLPTSKGTITIGMMLSGPLHARTGKSLQTHRRHLRNMPQLSRISAYTQERHTHISSWGVSGEIFDQSIAFPLPGPPIPVSQYCSLATLGANVTH